MVLSEYWKKLEENFFEEFLRKLRKIYCFEKFYLAFLKILKETLLGQEQMIPQKKDVIHTQLFAAENFEGVILSEGFHTHLQQKGVEKTVDLTEQIQEAKKCANLIPILWANCMPIAL